VDDGEDGVAFVEQGLAVGGVDAVVVRIESTADHPDDADAVGGLGVSVDAG
jgi:hypothetical protein